MPRPAASVHATKNIDPVTRRVVAVCDAAGAFIEYWGFKAVHGRIWTLLALRRQPMAQNEIAQLLGVSRSLVSGSIAELTERGLVRPESPRRNAPYLATLDVWPSISDVLRSREWMLLESARLALEAALEEAELTESSDKEPGPYDTDRMRLLLTMTEVSQSFLRMLIRMRAPPGMESFGNWFGKAGAWVRKARQYI